MFLLFENRAPIARRALSFKFRMDCISRHVACVALDLSSVERDYSGVVLPTLWPWGSVLGRADSGRVGRLVLPAREAQGLAQNGWPRLRLRIGVFCDELPLAYDTHLAGIFAFGVVFRFLLQRMDTLCENSGAAPNQGRGTLARLYL